QAQTNYANGVALGDTFFASAGDTGADFGFGTEMSNFPGSDLHNTAVTGTQGLPYNATGTLMPCPTSTPFSCTSGLSSYHGPRLTTMGRHHSLGEPSSRQPGQGSNR